MGGVEKYMRRGVESIQRVPFFLVTVSFERFFLNLLFLFPFSLFFILLAFSLSSVPPIRRSLKASFIVNSYLVSSERGE